jgi:hypothetical protein
LLFLVSVVTVGLAHLRGAGTTSRTFGLSQDA